MHQLKNTEWNPTTKFNMKFPWTSIVSKGAKGNPTQAVSWKIKLLRDRFLLQIFTQKLLCTAVLIAI